MFEDEAELRDYLSDNLSLIEDGLVKIVNEATLRSLNGASGRLDILARDRFDNIVVIEVKQSNVAARQTLHELSKYIVLLQSTGNASPAEIRCIVVSETWHELHEAFSFFVSQVSYKVQGFEVWYTSEGLVELNEKQPAQVSFERSFSPTSRIFSYSNAADQLEHINFMRRKGGMLRQFKAAALCLKKSSPDGERFKSIISVWRLSLEGLEDLSNAVQINQNHVGMWPGWEPEEAAVQWLTEDHDDLTTEEHHLRTWATPEKCENIFKSYEIVELVSVGKEAVGVTIDSNRIQEMLCGVTTLADAAEVNRYEVILSAAVSHRMRYAAVKREFMEFISFCPQWGEGAESFFEFAESQDGSEVSVSAARAPNFFGRLIQASKDKNLLLSYMRLECRAPNGKVALTGTGYMSWDQLTCPSDPLGEIEYAYGSSRIAHFAMYQRTKFEPAPGVLVRHGFYPCLLWVAGDGAAGGISVPRLDWTGTGFEVNALAEFAAKNPDYTESIRSALEQYGEIRTRPDSEGVVYTPLSTNDLDHISKKLKRGSSHRGRLR